MLKNIILSVAMFLAGFFGSHFVPTSVPSLGYQPGSNVITSATTSNVIVGSTSATVVATNTARTLLSISNTGIQPVYLSFGFAAVSQKGIMLAASSTYTLDTNHGTMYSGLITGITPTGSSTVSILEK